VQQGRFRLADARQAGQRGDIQAHHRERFGLALLALAQPGHGSRMARIAGQMEAAEALDGDDATVAQQAQGLRDRIAGQRLSRLIQQAQLRPARRAAGRFGMETAVGRRAVFHSARRTERKAGQAGRRPVVGNLPADRVTRPAMRAGGKGIAPAAVGRIAEIGDAGGTDRRIRPDGGRHLARRARQDDEALAGHLGRCAVDGIDARQARRLALQAAGKFLPVFAAHGSHHPGPVIAHPARQTEFVRQPPDEGPEADPLNEAANAEQPTGHAHPSRKSRKLTPSRSFAHYAARRLANAGCSDYTFRLAHPPRRAD